VKRAVVLVMCCGCGLGGKPPQYDYYVLTPTLTQARSPTTSDAADQPTVGVSRVTIPGYLDRESIVDRTDDYRLVYSKQSRWAEPLDQAFERTLRHELAATLAPAGIAVPPHTHAPTYDVQVDVLRFERRGADHVELWARWTVRTNTKVVRTGESRIRLGIGGTGNSAATAALSRTITRLAVEIGEQVQVAGAQDRSGRVRAGGA
jgi:uncharacterized lipoprotein YmbA